MTRREAKRILAALLADAAMELAERIPASYPGDDAERIRESGYEFAEELFRRAGLDRAREVDERQLSIYDVLGQDGA